MEEVFLREANNEFYWVRMPPGPRAHNGREVIMLKSALMITTSIAVGAGAVQLLHAAGSPPAYFIAIANWFAC